MHSIRQIQVVKALAQHRHFGRAANALGVSQPNLTRSLKQIEDALGVMLFDRQGVAPTLFAEIVLRHGDRVMADFSELMREVALVKGVESGELRIVASPYAADISGARAVGVLLGRHPNLSVEMRNANSELAINDVTSGAVDLAFAETGFANPELEILPVRASRLSLFCAAGHPLTKNKNIVLDDLLEYPWTGPIMPRRFSSSIPPIDKPSVVFDKALDCFRPRALVGCFAIAKEIVLGGSALGAAVPSQIERELREGRLAILPIEAPWLTLDYGFLYKRGRSLSPAAVAFMQIVREIEAGIPD